MTTESKDGTAGHEGPYVPWTDLGDDVALEDAVEALEGLPPLAVVADDYDDVWVKLPAGEEFIWRCAGGGTADTPGEARTSDELAEETLRIANLAPTPQTGAAGSETDR
jgi:hypothetical protein